MNRRAFLGAVAALVVAPTLAVKFAPVDAKLVMYGARWVVDPYCNVNQMLYVHVRDLPTFVYEGEAVRFARPGERKAPLAVITNIN